MKTHTLFLVLLLVLLAHDDTSAESAVHTSIGDVYEVKTGELVYREFHTFNKSPEEFMLSEYRTPKGVLIADRRVNFVNGYASDYVFTQPGLNIRNEVIRRADTIQYNSIKGDKTSAKEFTPKNIQQAVVNAGMFNAVNRDWARLIQGKTTKIDLVIPERGRTFVMTLKQVSTEKSEMAKHMNTQGKIVFNLTIASRLLRLLLDPVELGYDIDTKRLVFYQGPSNIRQSDGKKIGKIRIHYENS